MRWGVAFHAANHPAGLATLRQTTFRRVLGGVIIGGRRTATHWLLAIGMMR